MTNSTSFKQFKLNNELITTVTELGYEEATPVQIASIPILLEGQDLIAQAQTGTGKTAAFALPALSRIDLTLKKPQVLVLAPTRELAMQVAQAFKTYAKQVKGFNACAIYGGQDYKIQLNALSRGPQVIVGTPGRLMDHLRRGSLKPDAFNFVILDEADEMLKMGFVDDISWILEQIKSEHQTALFSATMPERIKKIAKKYLKDPKKVEIKTTTNTVEAIDQYYISVVQHQKLDLLTRILEIEDRQATIIFSRTKSGTTELSEKLHARGYAAAALNGDMNQSAREKVIARLKKGTLDLMVATDVAARGIDVERITHVINYDIPFDEESYIHRIGRTGRAGRKGKAILFVTSREKRLLKDIERVINKPIKLMEAPTIAMISEQRNKQLADKLIAIIQKSKNLGPHLNMVNQIIEQCDCKAEEVAAAFAYLSQQSNPLPLSDLSKDDKSSKNNRRKPGGKRPFEQRRRFSKSGDQKPEFKKRKSRDDKNTNYNKKKKYSTK